jgi:hypothetical protein
VGPGRRTDLELDVPATGLDHIPDRLPRLVPLFPGNGTVVVDLDAGVVVHLEPGDDVIHTRGTTAIVRRGKRLVVRDCVSGREQRLDVSVRPLGDALVTGAAIYVPPVILRLSSEDGTVKLLGRAPAEVLGMSDKGYVLVASRPGTVAAPANGPLRWRAPQALGRL